MYDCYQQACRLSLTQTLRVTQITKLQISAMLCIKGTELSASSLGRPTPGPVTRKTKAWQVHLWQLWDNSNHIWQFESGNIWVISTVSSISSKLQQAALDKQSKLLTIAGRVGTCLFLFPDPTLFLKPLYSFPIASQSEIIKKKKNQKKNQ